VFEAIRVTLMLGDWRPIPIGFTAITEASLFPAMAGNPHPFYSSSSERYNHPLIHYPKAAYLHTSNSLTY